MYSEFTNGIIDERKITLQFVTIIDVNKMQHEHEAARRLDFVKVQDNFNSVLRLDRDVFTVCQYCH